MKGAAFHKNSARRYSIDFTRSKMTTPERKKARGWDFQLPKHLWKPTVGESGLKAQLERAASSGSGFQTKVPKPDKRKQIRRFLQLRKKAHSQPLRIETSTWTTLNHSRKISQTRCKLLAQGNQPTPFPITNCRQCNR